MTFSSSEPLYEAGRRVWPSLKLDREHFDAYARARLESLPVDFDQQRAADLYLVCACLAGDATASKLFTQEYQTDIAMRARRIRGLGISSEDAAQQVLEQLLVGREGKECKLASYRGLGSLRSWMRATVARALIDLHRKNGHGREVCADDGIFEGLTSGDDPEFAFMRRHHTTEFKAAFETALATLSARARNALRHALVEGLSIDEIGSLYGLNRSTAARRIARARDELLAETRSQLSKRLQLDTQQVDSLIRSLSGRFDLSLSRVFAEARGDGLNLST